MNNFCVVSNTLIKALVPKSKIPTATLKEDWKQFCALPFFPLPVFHYIESFILSSFDLWKQRSKREVEKQKKKKGKKPQKKSDTNLVCLLLPACIDNSIGSEVKRQQKWAEQGTKWKPNAGLQKAIFPITPNYWAGSAPCPHPNAARLLWPQSKLYLPQRGQGHCLSAPLELHQLAWDYQSGRQIKIKLKIKYKYT